MSDSGISLARGVPSTDLLPRVGLARAWADALAESGSDCLLYGNPKGMSALRQWIARRSGVDEERVILTNGSLHALHLILELLVSPDQTVLVEQPAYDFTLAALRRTGAPIEGVVTDSDGLVISALAERLSHTPRPTLLYVNPTFQNPTGACLPRTRRMQLLALGRDHDVTIIEDDPYRDLWLDPAYGNPSLPTLLELDVGGEQVVRLVSFSKVVAPGFRCGAAIVPWGLVERLNALCNSLYISPGNVAHAVVAAFCQSDAFAQHLDRLRAALLERRDALTAALHAELGGYAEWNVPGGGLFLWVRLPGLSATDIAREASARGLAVVPGHGFVINGGDTDRLRLTFASEPAQRMLEAARRLASAVHAVASSRPS